MTAFWWLAVAWASSLPLVAVLYLWLRRKGDTE
jgi:hypothetical protein